VIARNQPHERDATEEPSPFAEEQADLHQEIEHGYLEIDEAEAELAHELTTSENLDWLFEEETPEIKAPEQERVEDDSDLEHETPEPRKNEEKAELLTIPTSFTEVPLELPEEPEQEIQNPSPEIVLADTEPEWPLESGNLPPLTPPEPIEQTTSHKPEKEQFEQEVLAEVEKAKRLQSRLESSQDPEEQLAEHLQELQRLTDMANRGQEWVSDSQDGNTRFTYESFDSQEALFMALHDQIETCMIIRSLNNNRDDLEAFERELAGTLPTAEIQLPARTHNAEPPAQELAWRTGISRLEISRQPGEPLQIRIIEDHASTDQAEALQGSLSKETSLTSF